jgi:hypothetical protein
MTLIVFLTIFPLRADWPYQAWLPCDVPILCLAEKLRRTCIQPMGIIQAPPSFQKIENTYQEGEMALTRNEVVYPASGGGHAEHRNRYGGRWNRAGGDGAGI